MIVPRRERAKAPNESADSLTGFRVRLNLHRQRAGWPCGLVRIPCDTMAGRQQGRRRPERRAKSSTPHPDADFAIVNKYYQRPNIEKRN
jgi:hypothetical protein